MRISHMLILLTSLSFMAGCDRQNTAAKPHDAPRSETSPEEAGIVSGAGVTPPQAALPQQTQDLLTAWRARLSPNTLHTEERASTTESRNSLMLLSDQVLLTVRKLEKSDPSRSEFLKIVADAALTGCDSELKKCLFNQALKGLPAITGLLVEFADQNASQDEASLRARYRVLGRAIDFSRTGAADRSALRRAYLRTAKTYEALLLNSPAPFDRQNLRSHREVTDLYIAELVDLPAGQIDRKLLAELATGFEVWNFDRARAQEAGFREGLILKLVARDLTANDEIAQRKLRDVFDKFDTSPDSLREQLKSTLAKRPKALENLQLTSEIPRDLTGLLLEGIWLEKITLTEASTLWAAFEADLSTEQRVAARAKAQVQLLSYLKIRMFATSQTANSVLLEFLAKPNQFAATDIISEAIRESEKGQRIWNTAIGRFGSLGKFHDQNLRSDQTAGPGRDIGLFLTDINRGIKLYSTYPSQLVLCYHAARLGFARSISTWSGSFTIDSGNILEWFFNGELKPWLPYGTDKSALSKSEIALVFYYALEMGTLTESVDLSLLLKMMTEQMIASLRAAVSKINQAYSRRFGTDLDGFYRLCQEEFSRQKRGITRHATLPMGLTALRYYTQMGFPLGSGDRNYTLKYEYAHPTLHEAWTFFLTENSKTNLTLTDNLELVRLRLTPTIDLLELYRTIVEKHLDVHQPSFSTAARKVMDDGIQPLKRQRKEFYTQMFGIYDRLTTCGETYFRAEKQTLSFAVNGLTAHLRDVYRSIRHLRVHRPNGISAMRSEFGFASTHKMDGLANHERALGYNTEGLRISRLQILLRVAQILQHGYTDDGKLVAAVRDQNSILVPSRITDVPWSFRTDEIDVAWTETEEEFITLGLQKFFDMSYGVLEWHKFGERFVAGPIRLAGVAALVKAGPQVIEQDGKDVVRRIGVGELARTALETLLSFEAETPMNEILTITSTYRNFRTPTALDGFAWQNGRENWFGLLDFAYENLTKDWLGAKSLSSEGRLLVAAGTGRWSPLETYIAHNRAMRSLGEPALAIPGYVVEGLTRLYADKLDAQVQYLKQFIEEAERLEAVRKGKPDVFPSWRLYSNRPAPSVPILSWAAVDGYDRKLQGLSQSFGYVIPADYVKAKQRVDETLRPK